MNVVTFMGTLSAFAFLIPVFILLVCRLAVNISLLSLLFYFLLTAVYNLISIGIIDFPKNLQQTAGVVTNYLDAPLMLVALLFFCTTAMQKKIIYLSLIFIIVYEIIIAAIFGFNTESLTYIMGPGILMLLLYTMYLFSFYVKLSIEKNKGFGKTFMITSILFAYGCYGMIYCLYYLQKTSAVADVFLIYYIASLLASLLMSIGLISYYKRFKQLKAIELTRKELQMFFGS